ncbi:hypothetical protein EDB80DRAFT_713888 [Ilyonectria destructans]|nr:hypothetical protein EDB80DRAFT_713888 [Ilyonectria destructans]
MCCCTKADRSRLFTNFGTLQTIHFTRSPRKYLSILQMHKTSARAQELLEPIYCDSLRCSQLFDEYLGKTDLSKKLYPIAEELRSQFIRWAGYAGAFAVPKASLDAQLSPHEDIKNMFLESLNMLELNLKWAMGNALDEEDPDAHVGLPVVKSTIEQLVTLSARIRQSAQEADKLMQEGKADDFRPLLKFIEHRFPRARKSLQRQLARSIHVRGTSLQYLQSRNLQFAYHKKHEDALAPGASTKQHTTKWLLSPPQINDYRHAVLGKPTLLPCITSGSSITQRETEGEFTYSTMLKGGFVTESSACYVCTESLDASKLTEEQWKKHIIRDLEPFICLSDECNESLQFFGSKREWIHHMQTRHTMDWARKVHSQQWHCNLDHKHTKRYEDKDSFLSHLKAEHGDRLTSSQALGRMRRNKVFARDPFSCPLCEQVPDELKDHLAERPYDVLADHIGQHLEALSFYSLQYLNMENKSGESTRDPKGSEPTAEQSRCNLFDDGRNSVDGALKPAEELMTVPSQMESFASKDALKIENHGDAIDATKGQELTDGVGMGAGDYTPKSSVAPLETASNHQLSPALGIGVKSESGSQAHVTAPPGSFLAPDSTSSQARINRTDATIAPIPVQYPLPTTPAKALLATLGPRHTVDPLQGVTPGRRIQPNGGEDEQSEDHRLKENVAAAAKEKPPDSNTNPIRPRDLSRVFQRAEVNGFMIPCPTFPISLNQSNGLELMSERQQALNSSLNTFGNDAQPSLATTWRPSANTVNSYERERTRAEGGLQSGSSEESHANQRYDPRRGTTDPPAVHSTHDNNRPCPLRLFGVSRKLHDEDFRDNVEYCPFYLQEPFMHAQVPFTSCERPRAEISHIISHMVSDHSILRGSHSVHKSQRYLTRCASDNPDAKGRSECHHCKNVALWKEEDLANEEHAGAAVCVRCYKQFLSKADLFRHLNTPGICTYREDLPMHKKSRILYSTFCSPNTVPKFQPPPSSKLRGDEAGKRNFKNGAVVQISRSQGSSQALPLSLPSTKPLQASLLNSTISPRVSETFIEPHFANYFRTPEAPLSPLQPMLTDDSTEPSYPDPDGHSETRPQMQNVDVQIVDWYKANPPPSSIPTQPVPPVEPPGEGWQHGAQRMQNVDVLDWYKANPSPSSVPPQPVQPVKHPGEGWQHSTRAYKKRPEEAYEALRKGQLGVRCQNSSFNLLGAKVKQDDGQTRHVEQRRPR